MMKNLIELQKSGAISKKELAERVAELKLSPFLAFLSKHSIPVVVFSMWSISGIATLGLLRQGLEYLDWRAYFVFSILPLVFIFTFVVVGVFWGSLTKAAIVEGKFPRTPDHPIYALRRIYGAAWAQIFYFKPIYAVCLAVPIFKKILFRGFGYKGSMNVVIYPDTWTRDLPMLKFEDGVYVANKSTLGTNICMQDNSIVVGPISLGKNVMIGHMAVFGFGCTLEESAELGVAANMGVRIHVGRNASIRPTAGVNHGAKIGAGAIVGSGAVVGAKAEIGEGVEIPTGAVIPPGKIIRTNDEASEYFVSEMESLRKRSSALMELLGEQLRHGPTNRLGS